MKREYSIILLKEKKIQKSEHKVATFHIGFGLVKIFKMFR